MLELCPAKRITATEALKHQYFLNKPLKEESTYKKKVKELHIKKLNSLLK